MRTLFVATLFIMVLGGCTPPRQNALEANMRPARIPTNALVLRVEALDVTSSSVDPSCSDTAQRVPDKNGNVCIPMHFWYTYRAHIREVLKGSWKDSEISFAYLQHTDFVPEVLRDFYVVLIPTQDSTDANLSAPYVAHDLLFGEFPEDLQRIRELRHGI